MICAIPVTAAAVFGIVTPGLVRKASAPYNATCERWTESRTAESLTFERIGGAESGGLRHHLEKLCFRFLAEAEKENRSRAQNYNTNFS